jgi:hypothetical protein
MEVVKIKAGGFYRRRDGQVVGPAENRNEPFTSYQFIVGGCCYTASGGFYCSGHEDSLDLIAEVTVTDVLPFELKAGEKYCTVKLDGTPGPVVRLQTKIDGDFYNSCFLYRCFKENEFCGVTADGVVHPKLTKSFRITSPYVEHKPPTIAERLEAWRKAHIAPDCHTAFDAIIADLKSQEAKS